MSDNALARAAMQTLAETAALLGVATWLISVSGWIGGLLGLVALCWMLWRLHDLGNASRGLAEDRVIDDLVDVRRRSRDALHGKCRGGAAERTDQDRPR